MSADFVEAVRRARWAWDEQQAVYTPHRDERWDVAMAAVSRCRPGRVVDVGCGPGTLTVRLAEYLRVRDPRWQVIGLEADGFLLDLAADCAGVTWLQGRDFSGFADGSLAAVVTSAVTHYFSAPALTEFYREALRVVGTGSVITIEELSEHSFGEGASIDPWRQWWDRVEQDPHLSALRAAHPVPRWETEGAGLLRPEHLECVAQAGGMPEVMWQRGSSVVLRCAAR